MAKKARATIFVEEAEEGPSTDYDWVIDWLVRWSDKTRIAGYSGEEYEHIWDVEGSRAAIAELPDAYLRSSDWVAPTSDGWQNRTSRLGMKFSLSKAKRLRNRARASSKD